MQTSAIGLNIFEGTDNVTKESFNSNFNLIDTKFGINGHKHTGAVGDGPKIEAANITINSANIAAKTLSGALDELFTGASSKLDTLAATAGVTEAANVQDILTSVGASKNTIVEFLQSRNIKAYLTDSMATLATKTLKLAEPCGMTAEAHHVLEGKTFVDRLGYTSTGTVKNNGAAVIRPELMGGVNYGLYPGYYSSITIKGDPRLISTNIKNGVWLCGYLGDAEYAENGWNAGDTIPESALIVHEQDELGNPISYKVVNWRYGA